LSLRKEERQKKRPYVRAEINKIEKNNKINETVGFSKRSAK